MTAGDQGSAQTIHVGIGELAVSNTRQLKTHGLGSCLAVGLYDPTTHWAGLVHVMLPEAPSQTPEVPGKYADTGIDKLYKQLLAAGAHATSITAKIAGGSDMFQSETFETHVGERNIVAVRQRLAGHEIPVVTADVGGTSGRTVMLDPTTGDLTVHDQTEETPS